MKRPGSARRAYFEQRLFIALTVLAIPTVALAGVIPPVPQLPQAAADTLPGAKATPENPDDPAKIAERIAANTKAAGERLAGQDTGDDTRKTQEQILKDIDALLKQNSPPMSGGGGGGQSNSNDMSKSGGQGGQGGQSGGQGGQQGGQGGQGNQGGNSSKSPMGGMGEANKKPEGGSGQHPGGRSTRRERREQEQGGQKGEKEPAGPGGQQPMPAGGQPMPGGKEPGGPGGNTPMNAGGHGNQPGGAAGQDGGLGGNKSNSALPLDDAISKQVWGHLPERLRQQMSQYYKEQFMPKYSDMLRQYYSSLAEREKAPRKP